MFGGDRSEAVELRLGLDVEAQHSGFERGAQSPPRSCRRRRRRSCRRAPPAASTRASSPPETMSKPEPSRASRFEYREVGVGLDRIADEDVASGASLAEFAISRFDRRARIDVAGRAELLRDLGERHVLRAQRAVPVRKKIHWRGTGLLFCLRISFWRGEIERRLLLPQPDRAMSTRRRPTVRRMAIRYFMLV